MQSPRDTWHAHHLDLKHDYLASYPRLLSSMLTGSYHPLKHRLAYFSSQFSGDPMSRSTVLGFYDVGGITVSDLLHPCSGPYAVLRMITQRVHMSRKERERFPRFHRRGWPMWGAVGDRGYQHALYPENRRHQSIRQRWTATPPTRTCQKILHRYGHRQLSGSQ